MPVPPTKYPTTILVVLVKPVITAEEVVLVPVCCIVTALNRVANVALDLVVPSHSNQPVGAIGVAKSAI
jgi:hypothetical protein